MCIQSTIISAPELGYDDMTVQVICISFRDDTHPDHTGFVLAYL